MKSLLTLVVALGLFSFLSCSNVSGQIDFDRPDLIKTSFAREMAASFEADKGAAKSVVPAPIADFGGNVSSGCSSCGGGGGNGFVGGPVFGGPSGDGGFSSGCGCDDGLWGDGGGSIDSGFSGFIGDVGGDCCGQGGRQMGLIVSGIVDVPLDGVFLTNTRGRTTAGELGATNFPAGSPVDLAFGELGFEEVYRVLGGVEANVTMALSCNTRMFFGYRFASGQARDLTVGTAIDAPLGAATPFDINATFSDYEESRLQLGFLTNNCIRSNLDFLWGGRIGVGFVEDISASFDVDGLGAINDVRLYDDTTNLAFGFNFGFQKQVSSQLAAHILTGVEYRTSLNEDNSQLATYDLQFLNDGGGFASLPVYIGFSYQR